MISGILAVDKQLGWTSHDVVAKVRTLTRQKQVGHAGTLDPLATGLLLVVLGRATKLSSYLMAHPKLYRAEIVLGATTSTDDAEGELIERLDPSHVSMEQLTQCIQGFVGEIDQVPPNYAAVRRGGRKLYELARGGIRIDAVPRKVVIHSIEVERFLPPRLRLLIRCGSGTYIRSLARDIGQSLGLGGYLHALRRLESGFFRVEKAHTLDGLTREHIETDMYSSDWAVLDLPAAVLTEDETRRVRTGQPVAVGHHEVEKIRLYDRSGSFVAIGVMDGDLARPIRVFEG